MSYEFYKVLHITGLSILIAALIGLVVEKKHNTSLGRPLNKKLWFSLHGVGLLIMLVAGFGLMARLGIFSPTPAWVWAKYAIWLGFGALAPLTSKRDLSVGTVMILVFALVSLAAWVAISKLAFLA